MFVPTKIVSHNIIEKKSRFIALALPFTKVKDLDMELNKIKKEYPKATHYLYAYKVNQTMKCNNDSEPGSIAQTFLTLINQYQLDQILIVVVRYFGGIKLGASPLLRTYHEVVNQLLKKMDKAEESLVYAYHFKCDYATFNKIKKLGYFIENVRYFDTIEIDIISKIDVINKLKELKIKNIQVERVKKVIHE